MQVQEQSQTRKNSNSQEKKTPAKVQEEPKAKVSRCSPIRLTYSEMRQHQEEKPKVEKKSAKVRIESNFFTNFQDNFP